MSVKEIFSVIAQGVFYGWAIGRSGIAGENRIRIYNSDKVVSFKRGLLYDTLVYDTHRNGDGICTYAYSVKPIYVKEIHTRPRPSIEYD
jgi:hypothetical protein